MARRVHLDRGEGYGFHLASENGNQFIRKIDSDSPAQFAGILDGDRLIGVNDTYIIGMNHKEVVNLIRLSEESVSLILVTASSEIRDLCDNDFMHLLWPREVTMTRKENGFGFVLHSERVRKTTKYFMTKITKYGSADDVGVSNDDRLIKINDEFITEEIEHKDVVNMIKNQTTMRLLLCHRETKITHLEMDNIKVVRKPEHIIAGQVPTDDSDEENHVEEQKSSQSLKTEIVAEINEISQPNSEKFETDTESIKSQSIQNVSMETKSNESTLSSNTEFIDMDFSQMSLSDLKQSIRAKTPSRRGPSFSEINWQKQKTVFKEL